MDNEKQIENKEINNTQGNIITNNIKLTLEMLKESPFHNEKSSQYTEGYLTKTVFDLLHTDFDYVKNELEKVNIKQVYSFNQLGDDFEVWEETKALGLVILPICNNYTSVSNEIKMLYKNTFNKEDKDLTYVFPVNSKNSYDRINEKFIEYYPSRNIIVALVNPFTEKKVFDYIINNINTIKPKFKSITEIWEERLDTMWKQNIIHNRRNKVSQYQQNETYISQYEEGLKKKWAENLILKKEIDALKDMNDEMKQALLKQIEEVKAMSVVKEFYVRDNIYLSFGNVYLYGEIKTYHENEEIYIKRERVEIGELKFSISANEITVSNKRSVDGHPHPHATQSSICFGAHKAQVAKLLAEMKLVELVIFLYSWAFSYNKADGPHIDLSEFYIERQKELKTKQLLNKKEE